MTPGRPFGSKNSYKMHGNHHKIKPPDFMKEMVKRATVRPLNETSVPWIYDCDFGTCHNTAHYKIFGDTFICTKHLDELKRRLNGDKMQSTGARLKQGE